MLILLTGATGFIGKPLAAQLHREGHSLAVLARNPQVSLAALPPGTRAFAWSAPGPVPDAALEGVEAVVHLAGENIGAARWTGARKRLLRASRVQGTRALVEAMARTRTARVLVAASAVGYYGDGGDRLLREDDAPGKDFAGQLAADWEREALRAGAWARVAVLRMGYVLGPGGMLARLLPVFRLGLGAVLGSGRQYWSWIHRDDVVNLYAWALANEEAQGPLNAVAPRQAANREFSEALARALHKPLMLRVPAFALRLGLGEMAGALLSGQRVSADKVQGLGYRFRFLDLDSALRDILVQRWS